jgi:hypothetical protein
MVYGMIGRLQNSAVAAAAVAEKQKKKNEELIAPVIEVDC